MFLQVLFSKFGLVTECKWKAYPVVSCVKRLQKGDFICYHSLMVRR